MLNGLADITPERRGAECYDIVDDSRDGRRSDQEPHLHRSARQPQAHEDGALANYWYHDDPAHKDDEYEVQKLTKNRKK